MTTVRKVQLYGKPQGFAFVEDNATRGAVVGANLFLPDGRVVTVDMLSGLGSTPAPAPVGGVIRTVSVAAWATLLNIPPNIVEAAALTGNGVIVRQADGNWLVREIEGTTDRVIVTDGDGEAGNPTIDLAEVPDAGTGELLKFTRDAYGRVSGTVPADLVDLGQAVILEAGGPLSALRAVATFPSGQTLTPTITFQPHADRVIGISITAASPGQDVVIQTSGVLTDASWSWSPGIIWCGIDGVLTQTVPTEATDYWILPVARAVDATTVIVDVGSPIFRLA